MLEMELADEEGVLVMDEQELELEELEDELDELELDGVGRKMGKWALVRLGGEEVPLVVRGP